MDHKDFEEWLILSRYGELDADRQIELDEHLAGCQECRRQQRDLMQLHDLLDRKPSQVSNEDVRTAREELLRLVELDRRQQAATAAGGWSPLLRMAASLALFLTGLGMGYILFASAEEPLQTASEDPFASRDIQVHNVQFQETDPVTGEVELSFYAARPVQIRGQVSDSRIQQLLAYALVNEQNPGVRLQAADAIRTRVPSSPDPNVRYALVAALQTDSNDGVRTKALQALSAYRMDPEVRGVLLHVLRFDDNPKLRMEAINLLESSVTQGGRVDDTMRAVLRESSENDDNDYIRLRARAVLQEVGYQ